MWGFISTTQSRSLALSYAFASSWRELIPTKKFVWCSCLKSQRRRASLKYLEQCSTEDRIPVLFEIVWSSSVHHYIQDVSAFPDEREVVIIDEVDFKIVDIQEMVNERAEEYYLIKLKEI